MNNINPPLGPTGTDILAKLKNAFPQGDVIVADPMSDDTHLQATIKSAQFNGLSRIAQHRLVNKALDGAFTTHLHALKITTQTME